MRDGALEFDHDNIFQKDKIISSQYRGRFDIEPQGTLENIKVMIDKCVVGNVPMMAIMTFGAAATALFMRVRLLDQSKPNNYTESWMPVII